jgi:hypothetical protein
MYLFTLFEPELFDRQLENERTDVAVVNESAVLESWYNYICACVCIFVVHNTVLYSDKKNL